MKITPAVEGPEPPQKIIALLARLIKRTPADVEAMLCTVAIRLAKVLVSTDIEKMVSILRRNGLAVEVSPLKGSPSAEEDGEQAELTGQTG